MELAVHIDLNDLPQDLMLIELSIPQNNLIGRLDELPEDWDSHPPGVATKVIGDNFVIDNQYLALRVPSVTVRGDYNYLLNPSHTVFNSVQIRSVKPFLLDKRLSE